MARAAGFMTGTSLKVKYGVRKLARDETRPTDLPFTDRYLPPAVAVDKAGNLYVGDALRASGKERVRKLASDADAPTQPSFPGLLEASRFAVDSNGDLLVADSWQKTAGSSNCRRAPPRGRNYLCRSVRPPWRSTPPTIFTSR
ncbi:hypothetical protein MSAS_34750 [Mycobacterium saskatchewanense]|uniref:SMP-30/Gluconolactonase/LRE-like region domain-containing protein n=1 Tax=Mycobacterium saskatchewanense TaxID=220927 RepID=A0AAJ3TUK7_9MYCO|nr:hypothetical protein [Mycobacterium saskatchewanense]ORW70541.1 hypothetical protein AWC23_16870 [Mycobacterium saskatchewanense]BBX64301.1 hypothetical protein MSAS_34750 [Mycobacterium saskatchewanense]